MLESAWLFTGVIGILATASTIYFAAANSPEDDAVVIASGAMGFITWGIWTYGTLNVEVVDGGAEFTFTMPELTLLGVALALIPGVLALTGPTEIVSRYRDGDPREL